MRDLAALPKAHLHLHLTGGMRPSTLLELAEEQGRRLPEGLLRPGGLEGVSRRGWIKFQRLYDAARDLLRGPDDVTRVVREIAEDNAAAGAGWVEVQVDPSSYAAKLGGLNGAVEVVLAAMQAASAETGVGMALVVAANRTRHPGDAETLARVARRYAGQGVVGFGLSNDETRGDTAAFAKAFRIARDAGLAAVPHAGELRGPGSVRLALEHLGPTRLGHGVRAVEEPAVLDLLVERGVVLEVCPASNVALGVRGSVDEVPVLQLRAAGLEVALGADDPLVFRSGLLDQYAPYTREQQADHAASSIRGSLAPEEVKARLLDGVAAW
jgi:adenosine deaminase